MGSGGCGTRNVEAAFLSFRGEGESHTPREIAGNSLFYADFRAFSVDLAK